MSNIQNGRVCEIRKNTFFVFFNGKEYSAKLKGSFYNGKEALFPLVGDYVEFDCNENGDSVIHKIVNRRNLLKRPDQAGHSAGFVKNMQEQSMVANFDYVFIVTALNADYSFNRVARYVSIALANDSIPVAILTKTDLCPDYADRVKEIQSLSDKVRVHAICALQGYGLKELEQNFTEGKTIVLIGSSGVGKSTLINSLAGEEIMKTSSIREEDSKGRHTTTHRQLITLKQGVTIIDTPGMREIGIHNAEEGINETFEDIKELESQCRFRDCKHKSEPGCAIQAALKSGQLLRDRYDLYCGLSNENRHNSKLRTKQIALLKKQIGKSQKNQKF